jgi:hypothetical protein
MKKYSINDLSEYSAWPAILLGLVPFKQRKKIRKEVIREFEKEKWGSLLKSIKNNNPLLKDAEKIIHGSKMIFYYDNGQFKKGADIDVHKIFVSKIIRSVLKYVRKEPVVELGAGYGPIIIKLAKNIRKRGNKIYALEFTKSGRNLLKLLSHNEKLNIEIGECDFTRKNISSLLIPADSIIFTSSSAYIVPKLTNNFVNKIVKMKPKTVIHIEPIYEHARTSNLFALMRKKYIELNDYNRNLLTILKKQEKKGIISIIEERPLFFGSNPLFCCSIVVWKPKL